MQYYWTYFFIPELGKSEVPTDLEISQQVDWRLIRGEKSVVLKPSDDYQESVGHDLEAIQEVQEIIDDDYQPSEHVNNNLLLEQLDIPDMEQIPPKVTTDFSVRGDLPRKLPHFRVQNGIIFGCISQACHAVNVHVIAILLYWQLAWTMWMRSGLKDGWSVTLPLSWNDISKTFLAHFKTRTRVLFGCQKFILLKWMTPVCKDMPTSF